MDNNISIVVNWYTRTPVGKTRKDEVKVRFHKQREGIKLNISFNQKAFLRMYPEGMITKFLSFGTVGNRMYFRKTESYEEGYEPTPNKTGTVFSINKNIDKDVYIPLLKYVGDYDLKFDDESKLFYIETKYESKGVNDGTE